MRLESLALLAYGPFRGLELDLSAPGMHVIFGRNEAGKSTTLRAITGLLYGIDRNTRDAHLHKASDLRIGGVLASAAGDRVRVVRRKGNSNTLLDERGQPLDEGVLLRLLRGVGEETFRHAFGLDHDTLQRGAEALLAGKGDLGESLFDASVGGGGEVQRLLAQLEAEADGLYRPRATSLPLNEALRAFADAQKLVRERQSLPEAYVKQEQTLEEARARRAELTHRRGELAARRGQLERARRRVPLERRRAAAVAGLAELGAVVRHAERIASLSARLVVYERACQEARERASELGVLDARLAEAARRAGVAAFEDGMRIDGRVEARVQRLVVDRAALANQIEAARVELERAGRELERARGAAAPLEAEDPVLARAVERARALGDAEARLATETTRAARRRQELEGRAAALGLFSGSLEQRAALPLPSPESVERLAARAAELEPKLARLDDRASELDAEALGVERQLAELTSELGPPDVAALRAARDARDALLRRLREAEDATSLARLAPDLERAVRDADELADRMIREADRVTMVARLRATREALARQRAHVEDERARLHAARSALEDEHRALFAPAGIAPLAFAEMRAWLDRHAQVVDAFARLREAERDAEDLLRAIDVAAAELREVLPPAAVEGARRLSDLVAAGTRELELRAAARRAAEEASRAAARLGDQIAERSAAKERDEERLAEVRARLAELVLPLGVDADAPAEEIAAALDARREVFATADRRAEVAARLATHEAEARAFEADVARAAAELAPEMAAAAPREIVEALAARARKALAHEQDLAAVDAQLLEMGDAPIADELQEVAADPEAAQAALDRLDVDVGELEREIQRLDQGIGGMEVGLEQMRADSHAADAAAQAQEALARVRTHVERWARAKLAAVLLAREIERYREENQGPLLAAASTLFARLTLGGFAGVRAGFDDKDRPTLRCVRAGGDEVDVAGLSEGTRDQLYLSLRLASLLRYAEIAEPMPLVLDDVLVQLDDERASAALVVLAEVSSRMQVLFFTHHARLVELARAAVPARDLHVHELASPAVPAASAAAPA